MSSPIPNIPKAPIYTESTTEHKTFPPESQFFFSTNGMSFGCNPTLCKYQSHYQPLLYSRDYVSESLVPNDEKNKSFVLSLVATNKTPIAGIIADFDKLPINHTNWNDFRAIYEPFTFNEHNQLFLNTGGNVFIDVSADSGFESMAGFLPESQGSASLTWALSMVDYDQDGDIDIITLDDQGSVPHPFQGGVPYGLF